MVTNVYSQYFQANATFSGVERRGALVLLVSDSEAGMISYKVAVSFFPHKDPEDSTIRVSPSYPSLEELGQALDVFAVCVKLAAVEKLLA